MAILIAVVLLVLSGVWAGSAVAGPPDKEADTTLDDHPSGKDRTEEPGNSGTQGKSASDPDGTANRGPDKPDGDGGFDADKDGNNGCGNDDDFEDDNNGNCRGRVQAQGTTETSTQSTTTTTTPVVTQAVVQGVTVEQPVDEAKVLGASFVRGETAALAATGAPTEELVLVGCALIALGALLMVGGRRREASLV